MTDLEIREQAARQMGQIMTECFLRIKQLSMEPSEANRLLGHCLEIWYQRHGRDTLDPMVGR